MKGEKNNFKKLKKVSSQKANMKVPKFNLPISSLNLNSIKSPKRSPTSTARGRKKKKLKPKKSNNDLINVLSGARKSSMNELGRSLLSITDRVRNRKSSMKEKQSFISSKNDSQSNSYIKQSPSKSSLRKLILGIRNRSNSRGENNQKCLCSKSHRNTKSNSIMNGNNN